MLKEKVKRVVEYVLLVVEMYCKFYGVKNMQLEIKENSVVLSVLMIMLVLNINLLLDIVCIKIINCVISICLQFLILFIVLQFIILED